MNPEEFFREIENHLLLDEIQIRCCKWNSRWPARFPNSLDLKSHPLKISRHIPVLTPHTEPDFCPY